MMPKNYDEITLSVIESYVSLRDKAILEIGCGDGRITRFLSSVPNSLIAFDPDLSVLDKAKKKAPNAGYLSASGLDLPFVDQAFDLVFFTLSLHHHPNCAGALAEAKRVLRTNGHVVVLEPANEGELEQICNVFNDEGLVLADAQRAIERSPMAVIGNEVFTTEWHMENSQELIDWLFEFYAVPFEQTMADEVMGLLGDKVNDSPLIVEDLTSITCLSAKA